MDCWRDQCRVSSFVIHVTYMLIEDALRPYIASCLLGCWLTDPLNNLLGRRGTIFVAGIFCTLSVIGSGCAQTWPQLFVRNVRASVSVSHDIPPPVIGLPPFARTWNGTKGYDGACLCRRKYPSKYSWGTCHVLADVGAYFCNHLP